MAENKSSKSSSPALDKENRENNNWFDVQGEDANESDKLKAKQWETIKKQTDDSSGQGNLHYGYGDGEERFDSEVSREMGAPAEVLNEAGARENADEKNSPGENRWADPEESQQVQETEIKASSATIGPESYDRVSGNRPVDEEVTVVHEEPSEIETPEAGVGRLRSQNKSTSSISSGSEEIAAAGNEEEYGSSAEVALTTEATGEGQEVTETPITETPSEPEVSTPEPPEVASPARISGEGGHVVEDSVLSLSGNLHIEDLNQGESFFRGDVFQGDYGQLELDENGEWTYSLANEQVNVQSLSEGETATDIFTVSSADGTTHQLVMTVTGTNDSPVLNLESTASVDEDGSKSISFSASDIDGEVSVSGEAAHGSVTINDDGSLTYEPNADFHGSDTITVTCVDDDGAKEVRTVEVTVEDVNDAPSLEIVSTASVDEDGSKSISFSASDIDGEVSVSGEAAHGSVTINDDGSLTYEPNADFHGSDTITVTCEDDDGAKEVRTVEVTVEDVNDAPSLEIVSTASVDEDGSKSISFSASDIDGEVSVSGEAAHGSVTINDDGSLTYEPNADFHGSDTITVTCVDDDGAKEVRTVEVSVEDVNDAPSLEIVSTASVDEDGSKSISFSASDIDGEVSVSGEAVNGSVTINDDGSLTYEPEADFHGSDTITVSCVDDDGAKVVRTVEVTVDEVNDVPVVGNVSVGAVDEDSSLSIDTETLLANSSDIDGGELEVVEIDLDVVNAAGEVVGSATRGADGQVVFTPGDTLNGLAEGENQEVHFSYTVADGQGGSARGTATLTVNGTDDKPVFEDSSAEVIESGTDNSGSTPVEGNVLANDTDADDGSSFTVVGIENGISVNETGNNGALVVDSTGDNDEILGGATSVNISLDVTSTDVSSNTALFSYNTDSQDNEFLVYNSAGGDLQFYLGGKSVSSGINSSEIYDGKEHSFNLSWDSEEGVAEFHLDGEQRGRANIGQGHVVGENGTLMFGQEQDRNDGGLDGGQTFSGSYGSIGIEVDGEPRANWNTFQSEDGRIVDSTGNFELETRGDVSVIETPVSADTVIEGQYGSLTLSSDGSYSYELNESDQSVQALHDGEQLTESFSLTVEENQAGVKGSEQLSITINGTNDGPVATDDTTFVTEAEVRVNDGDTNGALVLEEDAAGSLLGGATSVDLSIDVSSTDVSSNTALFSYTTDSQDNEFLVYNSAGGDLRLYLGGKNVSSGINASEIFDGEEHSFGLNWDSEKGVAEFHLDGDKRGSANIGQGHVIGDNGTLMFGQEQDSSGGSLDSSQVFSGAYHNIAISVDGGEGVSWDMTRLSDGKIMDSSGEFGLNLVGDAERAILETGELTCEAEGGLVINSGMLLANDSDGDGDTLSIISVSDDVVDTDGNVVGSASQDDEGNVVFTPGEGLQQLEFGESRQVNFSYTVSDGHGGTSSATASVTVEGSDEEPVFADDTIEIMESGEVNPDATPVEGNILANDTDGDVGSSFTVVGVENGISINETGNNGALVVDSTGDNAEILGGATSVNISLDVTSTDVSSNTALFSYNTDSQDNEFLVYNSAGGDLQFYLGGKSVSSGINSSEIYDGKEHSFNLSWDSEEGVAEFHLDGEQRGSANIGQGHVVGENGTLMFGQEQDRNDGGLDGGQTFSGSYGSIGIEVDGEPRANWNTFQSEDGRIVDSTGNFELETRGDVSVIETPVSADTVIEGQYGSLTLCSDGSYSYELNESDQSVQALHDGEQLTESFSLTVEENQAGVKGSEQLSITINGTNDGPVATDDTTFVTEAEVRVNDGDTNGALVLEEDAAGSLLGGATSVDLSIDVSSTDVSSNTALFSYTTDSQDNEFLVYNSAGGDLRLYLGGKNVSSGINASEIFDGEEHSFGLNWDSEKGVAEFHLDGDKRGSANIGQGHVIGDNGTLMFGQEQDSSGGSLDSSQVFSGAYHNIAISVDGGEGVSWDMTRLSDGKIMDSSGEFGLNLVGDAERAILETGELTCEAEGGLVINSGMLLANDSDGDGDTLSIISVSDDVVDTDGNVVGSASQDDEGNIVFTPGEELQQLEEGSSQQVSFSYTVSDGHGGENTATVNMNVEGSNDIPVLDVVSTVTVEEDGTAEISFAASDTHGSVETTAEAENGRVVVTDGSITYIPNEGYVGSDTIRVTTVDEEGSSVVKSVDVTVNEVENVITGTENADSLQGTDGTDLVMGMDGNDNIRVGGDDAMDTVDAGGGNDYIYAGGRDVIDGGEGVDTVDGRHASLSDDGTGMTTANMSNVENVYGSSYDDQLAGGDEANVLHGHDGDDQISGGGGNDTLIGGDGTDRISGGLGNDNIRVGGDDSADIIDAGGGNDYIYAGGRDVIDGGDGVDTVDGRHASLSDDGTGINTDKFTNVENVYGSIHRDQLLGGDVNNTLHGHDGDDHIDGGGGDDVLIGGTGVDTIHGGTGNDNIRAGGDDGADIISAGDGNDYIYAGGRDVIDGGDGIDTLDGRHATLSDDGIGLNAQNISNIENVYGSQYSDIISGSDSDSTLHGYGGDDTISGSVGNDTINGGQGSDTVSFHGNSNEYTFQLSGTTLIVTDSVEGRDGVDRITDVETLEFNDTSVEFTELAENIDQFNGATESHLESLLQVEQPLESLSVPAVDLDSSDPGIVSEISTLIEETKEEAEQQVQEVTQEVHVQVEANDSAIGIVDGPLVSELPSTILGDAPSVEVVSASSEAQAVSESGTTVIDTQVVVDGQTLQTDAAEIISEVETQIAQAETDLQESLVKTSIDSIGDLPSVDLDTSAVNVVEESTSVEVEKFVVTEQSGGASQDSQGTDKFVVSDGGQPVEDMSAMDGLDSTPADTAKEQEDIGLAGDEAAPVESVDAAPVIIEEVM